MSIILALIYKVAELELYKWSVCFGADTLCSCHVNLPIVHLKPRLVTVSAMHTHCLATTCKQLSIICCIWALHVSWVTVSESLGHVGVWVMHTELLAVLSRHCRMCYITGTFVHRFLLSLALQHLEQFVLVLIAHQALVLFVEEFFIRLCRSVFWYMEYFSLGHSRTRIFSNNSTYYGPTSVKLSGYVVLVVTDLMVSSFPGPHFSFSN